MDRKRKTLSQPNLLGESSNSKRSRKTNEDDDIEIAAGRAGRVLRIYLQNFMCHSALEINFDPNTNYIIGRNGSGKSAILTSLMVGLGGTALDTNRGPNLKAFIKNGEQIASIEITLSNTGAMAYNPVVFGDKIIILKSFNIKGTNTYRIKTASGKTISSSLREIHKLTDYLNININNPVCILNQEISRTFLNTDNPKKHYKLFMKSTNLESVKEQYEIARNNKTSTVALMQEKQNHLELLEKEVKKWWTKFKAFDIMTEVENKEKALEVEAVWAQIALVEEALDEKNKTVENITKEIQDCTDLIKNKNDRKNNLQENINQIRQQLLEIRNEEENNQTLTNTKRDNFHKLRETIIAKKNNIATIVNTIKQKQVDQENIEKEINNSSDYSKKRISIIQERDAQISKLDKNINEISKLLETAEHEFTQARSAHARKQREENDLFTEVTEISTQILQNKEKIRSFQNDKNAAVNVYGSHMNRILEQINASKEQFLKKPKGPIGSYIKIKDKKWALAVEETILRGMLMGFCVDNEKDSRLLSTIFAQTCGNQQKPRIICSKYFEKVHNYEKYKCQSPSDCVPFIDAIIVEDPVIMNCLIDQIKIERILLIPSAELAMQLMSEARRVPLNCSKAITNSGDIYYPDPNYRSYACRNKGARYLQTNSKDIIKILQEELQSITEKKQTVERQLRAVSTDVKQLSEDVKSMQLKMSKLEYAKSKSQRDVNDLKLQNLPPEPNLQILTEEIEEIKKIIEKKQAELVTLNEDMQSIKDQMKNAENEYTSTKNITKELDKRAKPLLAELNDNEMKLKEIGTHSKYNIEKLKRLQDQLVEAQRDVERKQKTLEEKLAATEALGPRIETKRNLERILAQLEETKNQLNEIRASMGNRKMISDMYNRVKEKYDTCKVEIDKIDDCMKKMIVTVDLRDKHYRKLAEYVGVRVREMFTAVLKIRQFKGTMNIDHKNKTLELVVIPQHGSSQGSGRTNILSGGEKTYSTVAFIHALWQVMEYPFYFLDEFDVFMDKVNRKIVMDILLEHAKEHQNLQYVFLTPQDISSVLDDKSITIHKLADPDR